MCGYSAALLRFNGFDFLRFLLGSRRGRFIFREDILRAIDGGAELRYRLFGRTASVYFIPVQFAIIFQSRLFFL